MELSMSLSMSSAAIMRRENDLFKALWDGAFLADRLAPAQRFLYADAALSSLITSFDAEIGGLRNRGPADLDAGQSGSAKPIVKLTAGGMPYLEFTADYLSWAAPWIVAGGPFTAVFLLNMAVPGAVMTLLGEGKSDSLSPFLQVYIDTSGYPHIDLRNDSSTYRMQATGTLAAATSGWEVLTIQYDQGVGWFRKNGVINGQTGQASYAGTITLDTSTLGAVNRNGSVSNTTTAAIGAIFIVPSISNVDLVAVEQELAAKAANDSGPTITPSKVLADSARTGLPRLPAIVMDDGSTVFCGVNRAKGAARITRINPATGQSEIPFTLRENSFGVYDDHDVGCPIKLHDGSLGVGYTRHNNDGLVRWRRSLTGDPVDLGSEVTAASLTATTYVQAWLGPTAGEVFLTTRDGSPDANTWPLRYSDDYGATWSAKRMLVRDDTTEPTSANFYCFGAEDTSGNVWGFCNPHYLNAQNALRLLKWDISSGDVSSYGGELVTNGTFNSGVTSWNTPASQGTGGISWDTDHMVLTRTGSTVGASQAKSVEAGKSYLCKCLARRDSGTGGANLVVRGADDNGSAALAFGTAVTSGTYTLISFIYTAASTGTVYLMPTVGTSAAVCSFDDISMREIGGVSGSVNSGSDAVVLYSLMPTLYTPASGYSMWISDVDASDGTLKALVSIGLNADLTNWTTYLFIHTGGDPFLAANWAQRIVGSNGAMVGSSGAAPLGACFEHRGASDLVIYFARESGGTYYLDKMSSSDGGQNWTTTNIKTASYPIHRPFSPKDATADVPVIWQEGAWAGYTNYNYQTARWAA